jgi:hypothetical protein
MKNLVITLVFITIITSIVGAQNIKTSTIQWNSQSTLEAGSGQQMEEVTSFVTVGTTRMEWKEANGNNRKNFQVIEAIGDWTDVNQHGWIQYEVTDGTSSGTISIRKNETETKIFITMASEPPLSYVLTINNHQVQ